ncbi:T9SS type A sorting domain-containing protein [Neolewinella persica]|uniref:T9SS type A sorting domain-containing protein n=1 Tax=Neolewinella persica TaxID=70998 RepID=UPI00036EA1AA|nr:T9SS type A sorting domain-containing protein [Neolewinella persica]
MYTINPTRAIFVALFFTLFSTASLFAQNCAHPDYSSLEELYNATGGDDWANNNGWLTSCEPCTWAGIGCDENNRVTSIILRGNGLTGALPVDIGDFDQLRVINLAYNEVAGELPASLFTIASLRDINFSGNRFSGTLPATIGEQPLLENLRLNNNQLAGTLPEALSTFSQMKILTLNNNGFTGSVPAGLGDLAFLFNLDVSQNNLSGCFPQDLENLCGNARMRFGGNSSLSWSGDFATFCSSGFATEQVGAPCDDGIPETEGDVITFDCGCSGELNPNGFTGAGLESIYEPDVAERDEQIRTRPGLGRVLPSFRQEITQLTVFPNPVVGDNLSVRLPLGSQNSQLRLLSLTGRVIINTTMDGPTTELLLPRLTAGVYLLESVTNGERSVQRVVVQ